MSGAINGIEAFEYLNTGTYASPTWARISRVEDVDLPDERETGELRIKGSDDVKTLVGPRKRSIAFRYKYKKGTDAIFTALQTAYTNKSIVDYMALDGAADVDGSKGHRGPYKVTKFSQSRPMVNPLEYDVELQVADTDEPGNDGTPWEVTAVTITVE